ncbi:hypothetical protein WISP_86878 [Willisornis vidua]|uniref:small monomeric GTPase n=1 Tax=Willisornis vidua TaxID=1566151 RepID=A0ABQ9D2X0_9PASS|nr:hypothetical protein WISP_86878 [Willisornis vidua]
MERFTDDTFCEACKSTVGVDFKIKTVELRGKKIRLQIWDTAGQERFNSITSAYYRSAKGIILVYDITKKETFDDLPKWMKMIDKYASEDAELLLVGNKLDCEVDREITRQQGEKFAQQITGMRFCEASAKDNFNVDEIFLKLVDDILKKLQCHFLGTLQLLSVFIDVKLNTGFKVRPHQCHVQRDKHCPSPCHPVPDTGQGASGLGHLGTLLAHVQLLSTSTPRSLSTGQLSSHFPQAYSMACGWCDLGPRLAFCHFEPQPIYTVCPDPSAEPSCPPADQNSFPTWCSIQTDCALNSLIQIINEDVKEDWSLGEAQLVTGC